MLILQSFKVIKQLQLVPVEAIQAFKHDTNVSVVNLVCIQNVTNSFFFLMPLPELQQLLFSFFRVLSLLLRNFLDSLKLLPKDLEYPLDIYTTMKILQSATKTTVGNLVLVWTRLTTLLLLSLSKTLLERYQKSILLYFNSLIFLQGATNSTVAILIIFQYATIAFQVY